MRIRDDTNYLMKRENGPEPRHEGKEYSGYLQEFWVCRTLLFKGIRSSEDLNWFARSITKMGKVSSMFLGRYCICRIETFRY